MRGGFRGGAAACARLTWSTTPRKVSNAGDEDLVMLVVGGKDGYVGRDGQLVDMDRDLPRRAAFGKEQQ